MVHRFIPGLWRQRVLTGINIIVPFDSAISVASFLTENMSFRKLASIIRLHDTPYIMHNLLRPIVTFGTARIIRNGAVLSISIFPVCNKQVNVMYQLSSFKCFRVTIRILDLVQQKIPEWGWPLIVWTPNCCTNQWENVRGLLVMVALYDDHSLSQNRNHAGVKTVPVIRNEADWWGNGNNA